MSKRTKSREKALQLLYQQDLSAQSQAEVSGVFVSHFKLSDEQTPYALELFEGIQEHIKDIDQIIEEHSQNWTLKRMGPIDRNLLRLSIYEMRYLKVPSQIAINEAIEIGKRFGGEKTAKFVHGILDATKQSEKSS